MITGTMFFITCGRGKEDSVGRAGARSREGAAGEAPERRARAAGEQPKRKMAGWQRAGRLARGDGQRAEQSPRPEVIARARARARPQQGSGESARTSVGCMIPMDTMPTLDLAVP